MTLTVSAQFSFGAGATLVFDGSYFGVQGKAMYDVNETISAAGTFSYILDDFADYAIDFDAHYKLLNVSEDFSLRPLAGLNIVSYSAGIVGFSGTEIGINLGAMFSLSLGEAGTNIYVEPKIVLGGWKSLVISGGILF